MVSLTPKVTLTSTTRHEQHGSVDACLVGPTSGATSYTAGHEHSLSEQPFRCEVGLPSTDLTNKVTM
jgi:hypothetical protein